MNRVMLSLRQLKITRLWSCLAVRTATATWAQTVQMCIVASPRFTPSAAQIGPVTPNCWRFTTRGPSPIELFVSGVENFRMSVRQPSHHNSTLKYFQAPLAKKGLGLIMRFHVGPRLAMNGTAMNLTRTFCRTGQSCFLDNATHDRLGTPKNRWHCPEKEL